MSQNFSFIFFVEFSIRFSVSAENPTSNFGLDLLFFPKKFNISTFFSTLISSSFFSFLILYFFLLRGLKSETAAVQTAISTGKLFLQYLAFEPEVTFLTFISLL